MLNKANLLQLFVGQRQSGKTTRALSAVHSWVTAHYGVNHKVHCFGYSDVSAKAQLERLNMLLLDHNGSPLVFINNAGAGGTVQAHEQYFHGVRKEYLLKQLEVEIPQCFYLEDLPPVMLGYVAVLAAAYTQHTFIVELMSE